MTTLVALATKDAVVMGSDSLATSTKLFLDPFQLVGFFDHNDSWKLRIGPDGKPALTDFLQLIDLSEGVPHSHMTDVDKLLDLTPLPMGVMFSGITSIGDRTIKSLVSEFKAKDKAFPKKTKPKNFTVKSVATRLLAHFRQYYDKEFGGTSPLASPALELLVAGYDMSNPLPRIFRIDVGDNTASLTLDVPGVAFGGQMDAIQRIVFGVDSRGRFAAEKRYESRIREFLRQLLALNSAPVNAPDVSAFVQSHRLFGKEDPNNPNSPGLIFPGLTADWGDFSEQNALDCVAYFISVMRETQRFSSGMPTVGGSIHVALIRRESGFKFISREEYRHEDHRVQRREIDVSRG